MKLIKGLLAVGLGWSAGVSAAVPEDNTWQYAGDGNAPATAYAWSDAANWSLGAPTDAQWLKLPNRTAVYYVKMPDEAVAGRLLQRSSVVLLGEKLSLTDRSIDVTPMFEGGTLFADLYTKDDSSSRLPWLSDSFLAGRVIAPTGPIVPAGGTLTFALDRYATSADPVRTDDIQLNAADSNGGLIPGSASVAARVAGAAASTSAWKLVAGSPYIELADAAADAVAAGAAVTGPGVPEGAFVRRVIRASKYLELSAPATETLDAAALAFAAHHPQATLTVPFYGRQAYGSSFFKLLRRCPEDVLRMDIGEFRNIGPGATADKTGTYLLGLDATDVANGWLPGTFVLHDVVGAARPVVPSELLRTCHFEFAGTASGGPTVFPAARPVAFDSAAATARMTVPEGRTGGIAALSSFTGTLVKDGAGRLEIGLVDAANAGAAVVEAGTLVLTAPGAATLGRLAVRAGAALQLPEGGLAVGTAAFADGAEIVGPGELVVHAATEKGVLTLRNGATVRYELGAEHAYADGELPDAPAGHPAFWVDASKPETLVTEQADGVDYVTRWNDCRPGEPMFCTNLVQRPVYVHGTEMADKYVRLANHNPLQSLGQIEQLVWSVPVKDIRAVFLVQNPVDGGGNILGRCSWRLDNGYYGSQGGPYYRGGSTNWRTPLIARNYGTACVTNGAFYLDGEAVDGLATGYKGAFLQLVEHHVNPAYRASGAHSELWADAFGTGYVLSDSWLKFVGGENGGMRIAEYVIYTNELTFVDRIQTERYLMNKWLGRTVTRIDYDEQKTIDAFKMGGDEVLCVDAGRMAGIRRVEEASTLVKDGEGRLVVESLAAGDVTVLAGELLVNSFPLRNASVPGAPWVHVDASDASTLTLEGDNVTEWKNANGDGQAYRAVVGKGKLVPNALNGLPVVSTGTRDGADASVFRLYDPSGTPYVHSDANSYITGVPFFKAVLAVFGSKGGGGNILGSWGNGFPWQGLATTGETILVKKPDYEAFQDNVYPHFFDGVYTVRLNGESINPFATPFSGGYDQLTFQADWSRKSDTLATYGQGFGKKGGLEYGELLVYTNVLGAADLAAAEAYLRKKWFDVDTPGICAASCGTLLVGAGASVVVGEGRPGLGRVDAQGAGTIRAAGIGGAGTVRGSVAGAGEVVGLVDDEGRIGTLTVTGDVDLSKGGEVRLAGAVDKLKLGVYKVCSAGRLAFGGTWSADPGDRRVVLSLHAVGNDLYLSVNTPATVILLR